MYISSQRFERLEHLITCPFGCGFEGQPIHDVAHAPQIPILISRAGVDIDSNAGKVSRQGFGSNPHSVRKGRDLVKLYRVLE